MTATVAGLLRIARARWRVALFLAVAAYAALLQLRLGEEKVHGAKLQMRLVETSLLLDRERAEVRLQTAKALAEDVAHAARVERDQAMISKESVSDYQKDIAALRAASGRVRAAPAGTTSGSRAGQDLPGLSGPAGGTDGASFENPLPTDDALIASEIALRLKALQSWVHRQANASPGDRPGD